jgi:2-amino-4-hydroxy-6-hydroxymethyldihydropteridine diphosphokinase
MLIDKFVCMGKMAAVSGGGDRRIDCRRRNVAARKAPPMFFSCLIGLGSNLGDRRQLLEEAVACLDVLSQVRITGKSSWRETSAVGGPAQQPPYLNGAVSLETSLSPQSLLAALQRIETQLGRTRQQRWEARTVDLDLLLHDRTILDTPSLVIPHPRMAWRRFVLEPAAEIAGSMPHPTIGWTISKLLDHLNTTPPYVAVTGSIGVGKTHLATRLAEETGAKLLIEQLDDRRLETFYADTAGQSWDMELEFIEQRTRLLSPDAAPWPNPGRLVISDFWYDQSAAFARVWLPDEKQQSFIEHCRRSRRRVVCPRLVVLLECPAEELHSRVVGRGRRFERGLSAGQLEQIGLAIAEQTTAPDRGPVLRLTNNDPQAAFEEVLAAVEAMQ